MAPTFSESWHVGRIAMLTGCDEAVVKDETEEEGPDGVGGV